MEKKCIDVKIMPCERVPEPSRIKFGIPATGYAKKIIYEGSPISIEYKYVSATVTEFFSSIIPKKE